MTSLFSLSNLEEKPELIETRFSQSHNPEAIFWYRVERGYASHALYLEVFEEIEKTPSGVIVDCQGERKFILSGTNGKRFAYPTKELALDSFWRRKKREIEILEARLTFAKKLKVTVEFFIQEGKANG